MSVVSLDQLSFEAFAEMVKTKWRVLAGTGDGFELELVAVTPRRLTPAGSAGGWANEQFTLVLQGPAEPLLTQRTYSFEAGSVGRFDLFIVPTGRDAAGIQYEATFNRTVAGR